jgi:hypothetical protein
MEKWAVAVVLQYRIEEFIVAVYIVSRCGGFGFYGFLFPFGLPCATGSHSTAAGLKDSSGRCNHFCGFLLPSGLPCAAVSQSIAAGLTGSCGRCNLFCVFLLPFGLPCVAASQSIAASAIDFVVFVA